MAYCIAVVLMFLKVFLMVTIGILRFSSSIFIDGMWAVANFHTQTYWYVGGG